MESYTSVRFDCVGRETDQLNASLGKLGLKLCESAQFGCADWSVVLGMGEENGPLIANPFMEINWACGGFGLEVGCSGPEAESVKRLNPTLIYAWNGD